MFVGYLDFLCPLINNPTTTLYLSFIDVFRTSNQESGVCHAGKQLTCTFFLLKEQLVFQSNEAEAVCVPYNGWLDFTTNHISKYQYDPLLWQGENMYDSGYSWRNILVREFFGYYQLSTTKEPRRLSHVLNFQMEYLLLCDLTFLFEFILRENPVENPNKNMPHLVSYIFFFPVCISRTNQTSKFLYYYCPFFSPLRSTLHYPQCLEK